MIGVTKFMALVSHAVPPKDEERIPRGTIVRKLFAAFLVAFILLGGPAILLATVILTARRLQPLLEEDDRLEVSGYACALGVCGCETSSHVPTAECSSKPTAYRASAKR